MIDLDERLDRACTTVRSQINSIPVRPPAEIVRRHHRSRMVTVASGIAAIAVLVFASSFIFRGGGNEFAGQETAPIPARTYTLDLPGWDLIAVWEAEDGSGRSHTLFDDEGSSEDALRRVKINTGSAAIERRDTLQVRGIQSADTISLYGADAAMYLTGGDAELGWATVIVTWTGPQDEHVAILFEGVELEEAKHLLIGLTPLDLAAWQSLTNAYEPPVTTTITG